MSNPLGLKAHHVTARVRNLDDIVAWYLDVLGLELVNRGERLSGRMRFATLAFPGYALSFLQLDEPATEVAPGTALVPAWVHPVFSVPDPARVYERFVARGVRVAIYGPKPQRVTSFVFYDCEGNELEIVPEEA